MVHIEHSYICEMTCFKKFFAHKDSVWFSETTIKYAVYQSQNIT